MIFAIQFFRRFGFFPFFQFINQWKCGFFPKFAAENVTTMNKYTQLALLSASTLRMLPHIALYLAHRGKINPDLLKVQDRRGTVVNFIKACTRERTFRNLFYYRIGEYKSALVKWMLPPERTLNIWCPEIGPGAHFEHNYATYLNAERIGSDFYCLQLVTLGNGRGGRPTIGNNVRIYTGAIVFGGITIGDNAVIGAGAVVRHDVPPGCTVAGNPAEIVGRSEG